MCLESVCDFMCMCVFVYLRVRACSHVHMRAHLTLCHYSRKFSVLNTNQGRIQDNSLGGGQKKRCARTHITSAEPNSLSAGVQGPGSSRVVLMLFRVIWALFLSILMKKNIVDQILGGRLLLPPPTPWILHYQRCSKWDKDSAGVEMSARHVLKELTSRRSSLTCSVDCDNQRTSIS